MRQAKQGQLVSPEMQKPREIWGKPIQFVTTEGVAKL
jgi:hypothetical protein